MSFQSFREKVNLALYDSKKRVLHSMQITSLFVSLVVVILMVAAFGFPMTDHYNDIFLIVVRTSLWFYVLKFVVSLVYSYQPLKLIRETLFESTLMVLLTINFLSGVLFEKSLLILLSEYLKIFDLTNFSIFFIQAYFLIIVFLEIGKAGVLLKNIRVNPQLMLIVSFLLLIGIGTILLMMPEMTVMEGGMNFMDAMFTSISASCVTGLIVVDTANFFTFKGHFVILTLIQLGGLNIVSFASLFTIFSRSGVGIKHQRMIQDNFDSSSLSDSMRLLKRIFYFSFVIEMVGFLAIFFSWHDNLVWENLTDKLFYSVFHAVSAFNNAGFSLFSNGLFEDYVRHSYMLHLVLIVLIFFGSIGFQSILDMFGIQRIRERIQKPWKGYKLETRIALYSSISLLVIRTLVFYLLEGNNTLEGYKEGEKWITALFQSMTARTAGFNTVDFGALSVSMLCFYLLLMFIGASSGSTGGGIKTSTFVLLIFSSISTLTGKRKMVIGNRKISINLVNKAFSLFLFAVSVIFMGVFILTITDSDKALIDLIFEEVSAFATVGLSTGITSSLSTGGRIVIMISMFLGRVGLLTLAFALGQTGTPPRVEYPGAHIAVG
jgi:potassium uptake TrkH family protein